MNARIFVSLAISCVVGGHALCLKASPDVQISPAYVLRQNADPPREVVSLRFYIIQDGKTNIAKRILVITNGAPFDAASYELKDTTANKIIKLAPVPDLKSGPLVSTLDLLPETPLSQSDDYELRVLAGKVFLRLPGINSNMPNAELKGVTKGSSIQVNEAHQTTNTFQSRISLLGGTAGGVSSIDLTYRTVEFLNVDWLNIDFNAKADFSLSPQDKTNYFNSISGGANIWYPALLCGNYSELGIHGKFESDQEFDRIDGLIGAQYAVLPNFEVTRWISKVFVKDVVDVPPLVVFGYDYAHNVSGNGATGPVNTEAADNRLSALLRWRIYLARNYDLSALPALGGRYDIDFDFELNGIYDINAEKFLDQSRISLEFTPRVTGAVKPGLVFTWARGKAGPTFKEISALLAGLKLSF